MKTLFLLPALALLPLLGLTPRVAAESARDAAVRAAVAAVEDRVVQLRYFGDAGGALGSAAPTLTGYEIGEGWVLTSLYDLIEKPAAILCGVRGAEPVEARVVARDYGRGLALLRLTTASDSTPRLGGRRPRVGETAIAVGRVYEAERVNAAVGVVSAVGRIGARALQTDAATSPANYGGPLIGLDGAFLGLIVPLAPRGQSAVGLYDSGVGFAVPASQIEPRLAWLAEGSDLRPGWLGVGVSDEDPLRLPARIVSVSHEGPAAEAGLQEGDIVTALAREPTPTVWLFRRRLRGLDAGQKVEIEVSRGGSPVGPLAVTLIERPPSEAL